MKHTPGPWKAFRNSAFWEVVPESKGPGIPLTVGSVCESGPSNPDGGLQEANARLFAAATDLREVALAYEAWEADLIMNNESWGAFGMNEVPTITASQWDRLIEIQAMRNAAVKKAEGES